MKKNGKTKENIITLREDVTTVSVLSAAKRLGNISDWSLTNLEMQKLLYIANMYHLGRHEEPLIDGHFEAWRYGPVHPTLFYAVGRFGTDHVENIFQEYVDIPNNSKAAESIDKTYRNLADFTPGRLTAITHWKEGALRKNYNPGVRGIPIPNEHIREEYNKRIGR